MADARGLSRNAVSKVFNGCGSLSQAAKEIIVKKTEELAHQYYDLRKKERWHWNIQINTRSFRI